jgi:hypothetical protein
MRDILNADDDDEPSPDTVTPDSNSELLIGGETPGSASPEDLWPDAGHVFRLWQIYLDRVNPLTKIIHAPTLQPYVVNSSSGCSSLPKNYEALLFSIWLMAAVAMAPEECEAVLGYSREVAVQRFSSGVRMALVRLNFLKTHEVVALQALVIYLVGAMRETDIIFANCMRSAYVTPADFTSGSVQSPCRLDSERRGHPHCAKDGITP